MDSFQNIFKTKAQRISLATMAGYPKTYLNPSIRLRLQTNLDNYELSRVLNDSKFIIYLESIRVVHHYRPRDPNLEGMSYHAKFHMP